MMCEVYLMSQLATTLKTHIIMSSFGIQQQTSICTLNIASTNDVNNLTETV